MYLQGLYGIEKIESCGRQPRLSLSRSLHRCAAALNFRNFASKMRARLRRLRPHTFWPTLGRQSDRVVFKIIDDYLPCTYYENIRAGFFSFFTRSSFFLRFRREPHFTPRLLRPEFSRQKFPLHRLGGIVRLRTYSAN